MQFALLIVVSTQFSSMVFAQAFIDSAPSDIAPRREKPEPAVAQLRVDLGMGTVWASAKAVHWQPVDVAALLAEDAVRDATPGVPMRIGVTRDAPGGVITPATAGTWADLPGGAAVWLLRLEAADAKAIRIHFSRFDLEEGAEVRLRGILEGVDAYRGKGPNDDAAFWPAPTPGDVAYLEYFHPRGKRDAQLEIDVISHFYRDPGFLPPQAQPNVPGDPEGLLACQQSVMCHEVDETSRDAVGRMIFDGGFLCSGALINDMDANTFAGYFLTANHCISTQSSASSLTAYWFYQPSSCGGPVPPLSLRPKSIGATLLAHSSLSDFSFMRFNNDPEDGQGLAAWTTSTPSGTVHGIHHPGGSWKRYSMGTTTTSSPICGTLPLARYVYNDWSVGITEGGSSGSPLFNTNWQVVGQLYGVCCSFACSAVDYCNRPQDYNNVYGRFSQSYTSFSSYLNAIIPDDVYENNDSIAEAPVLDEGTHALRLVDYDDYFKVAFDEGVDMTLSATFATAGMDLDLYLLDELGAAVATSAGSSGTETIITTVPAGIYFIRAAKDTGWGGDYTLNFSAFRSDCPPPTTASAEPAGYLKNRFISIIPGNAGTQTAIRVILVSLQRPDPPNLGAQPQDFSAFEGQVRWVGPPAEYTESINPAITFKGATLQCDPHFMDWGSEGLVHIFGSEIVPSSEYDLALISPECDVADETNFSGMLTVRTGVWGDIVDPIQQPSPALRTQPDFGDLSGIVDKFKALPASPIVARTMLQPNIPDPAMPVNFSDISACVDAFKGVVYPYQGPVPCP